MTGGWSLVRGLIWLRKGGHGALLLFSYHDGVVYRGNGRGFCGLGCAGGMICSLPCGLCSTEIKTDIKVSNDACLSQKLYLKTNIAVTFTSAACSLTSKLV
jgi:hypothetical protein